MTQNQSVGFIGAGNMARSLVGGLLNSGWPASLIRVSDPDQAKQEYFFERYDVQALADNDTLVSRSDTVVLAVKPQLMKEVLTQLASSLQARRPLIVSIAAGIRSEDIDRWGGGDLAVVRVMPNTPALVGSGASGLYANGRVDESQRSSAESIMRAVGVAVWLGQEDLLDIVTALSGSGPAYFLLFMEALERAATELGLPADIAHLLTLETGLGTAKLAMESPESLTELRRRVTSPGGTTEHAINEFETGGLPGLVEQALGAAAERSRELADKLGGS